MFNALSHLFETLELIFHISFGECSDEQIKSKSNNGTWGNKGKSIGEVFNEIHGRHVGGNSQTLNVNGNKIADDFGTEDNKASHAVFLADLRHGQHGHMFKADYENFKAVALASGVKEENIKVVDN